MCVGKDWLYKKDMLAPTALINNLTNVVDKYKTLWAVRDESENFPQAHDENIARDILRPQVTEEAKTQCDKELESYFINIKTKIGAPKKPDRKKPKKPKKPKGKKGKKGKGKGAKEEKENEKFPPLMKCCKSLKVPAISINSINSLIPHLFCSIFLIIFFLMLNRITCKKICVHVVICIYLGLYGEHSESRAWC